MEEYTTVRLTSKEIKEILKIIKIELKNIGYEVCNESNSRSFSIVRLFRYKLQEVFEEVYDTFGCVEDMILDRLKTDITCGIVVSKYCNNLNKTSKYYINKQINKNLFQVVNLKTLKVYNKNRRNLEQDYFKVENYKVDANTIQTITMLYGGY